MTIPGAGMPLIGMGCMRLSTERDRDEARALAVLHAALDAGVTLLDTADAYCLDEHDAGHNERLIARALASWKGDRSRIVVATKGGLTRPGGNWVPDGRARHLAAACTASRQALGVDRIALYQLHAPDTRTPFATSVRALAALREEGHVEHIGLCNVTVGQIQEARAITEIASIQVELSLWNDSGIASGVADYCIANGIRFLAYRPLGGARRRRQVQQDPVLVELAGRHGVTPFEIALAGLTDLSPLIVPLPGPTRVETAQSAARAATIVLTDEDRDRLDALCPAARRLRTSTRKNPSNSPNLSNRREGEVVLVMGLPGAGKSTVAQSFVSDGYARLNRDEAGGSLSNLLPALDRVVAGGSARVVLDNTYLSRASRARVIDAAGRLGLEVRCVWLTTSVEDAQINAVTRMLSRYGRLLEPDEIRKTSRKDPGVFAPTAQFRAQRELEPPDAAEGFSRVETLPFERRRDPSFANRAVIVWCDGVLWRSRSGARTPADAGDVEIVSEGAEVLRRYQADGWKLLGLTWQPEVADGTRTRSDVDASLARMQDLLGTRIEVECCTHPAGPPVCWCRKPLPGLGVVFIEQHRLDPAQCIYLGAGPQDRAFARAFGFQFSSA